MQQLPSKVAERLEQSSDSLNVVFEITKNGNAKFVYVNHNFIDFHTQLSIQVSEENIIGLNLEDYFRFYLGFTDDQIESRMLIIHESVSTGLPHASKEISDHPGILLMVLDSKWHPFKTDSKDYVLWESSLYTETKI